MDMYQTPNYPNDTEARKGISCSVSLALHTEDGTYLRKLKEKLPECLAKFHPDLLVYNAGTDPLVGDPLGGLSISPRGLVERDEFVFECAISRNIPIVMVLSGGYQKSNARIIADSIINLHNRFNILTPRSGREA